MESANEKMAEMMKKNQERQVKEEIKKFNKNKGKVAQVYESYGGTGSSTVPKNGEEKEDAFTKLGEIAPTSSADVFPESSAFDTPADDGYTKKKSTLSKGKGLTLGKKKKKAAEAREKKKKAQLKKKLGKAEAEAAEGTPFNPLDAAVVFEQVEKVSCKMDRDGGEKKFSVKGELRMTVRDPARKKMAVKVDTSNIPKAAKVKPYPAKMDKKMWKNGGVLMLKNDKLEFEAGKVIPAVLYTLEEKEGAMSPVVINVRVSESTLDLDAEFNNEQSWLSQG